MKTNITEAQIGECVQEYVVIHGINGSREVDMIKKNYPLMWH